ncbi:MAG: glycosyltransferase family 4 protein [Candidatus Promineifilaceae bacterium]
MRIALVSGEYPPLEGGVGAFTQELARALAELDQEVHVISTRAASPANIERRHFGRDPDPIDIGFAQLHPQIDRWRWPSVATIADLTLRYEFDAVNIQYQAAAYNMNSGAINLLPWRLKHITRTVVTFHDLRTPYLFPKAGRLRSAVITTMARQAAGVIATNMVDAEDLKRRAPKTLSTTIPIGSNIGTYRANHIELAEARELLGLRDDDVLLGYFGFINDSKGADSLLQALAQLPENYHLVFIGGQTGASDDTNAAYLAQIEALILELGLQSRVHWTGFIADERVSVFLQAAEMMVMPYKDGVSLRRGTLMAVLAHGRPLITTLPVVPIPELVAGRNVLFVPPADTSALAKTITELARNEALQERLGKNAALLAGQFSWEAIARRTLDFFHHITDPRR